MTLTQYKYIIAIYNHKSFAEASKHCFVTQPTLSMQVKKFEDECGVIIFDRSKQPVEPTEIGKKIIEQARVILREHKRVNEMIEQEKGELKGRFKIGIIPTIAPYLIPLFLVNFIKKFPSVELIFDELQTDQILDRLVKDELDTAIIATPTNKRELIERPIYHEPFVAYVSESHKFFQQKKIDPNFLKVEDLWLLKEGHCLREQVIQVCNSITPNFTDKPVQLSFEGGTLDTLMKLVDNNFGMTLLPYLASQELRETKRWKYVREFEHPVPNRIINIAYHRSYLKKQLIEAIENEIITAVPASLLRRDDGIVAA